MSNKIYLENDITISNKFSENDLFKVEDSVKSIGVKIEAARSGRINSNLVLYTPRAMEQGMKSFIYPFKKHLQADHNGEAVGVITEAEYVPELFPKASKQFINIANKVDKSARESNGPELVKAIKELIKTKEYNSPEYRGLGIANICGDIYNPNIIYEIKTRQTNKGTVSIGGKSSEVYCSVCSERFGGNHEHKKGHMYNNELCFYINNDLYLDHCGFVTTPADKYTKTEIVRDSEESGLEVDVTNYKTNSTESLMNLTQLKELAKDSVAVKSLIKEYFTDEEKATLAQEKYEKSLEYSRSNHYLFSDGNVLNLRTPVGIYVAEKLIEKFDDADEDKQYLIETLQNAKTLLKIDNTDTALEEFLTVVKQETEDKKDEAQTEGKKEETETTPTTEEESKTPVTVKDSDDFLTQLKEFIDDRLETFKQAMTTKVEDSKSTTLRQELNSLRTNLEADEEVIAALQKDYAESLIETILTLKGDNVTEAYKEKLKDRTTDQLKLTLEDLKESLKTRQENKEAVPNLQTTSASEAISQVQDKQQNLDQENTTEPTKGEEDSPETTTKVEDSVNDPQEWFKQRIAEVGLAKASREYKIKFN